MSRLEQAPPSRAARTGLSRTADGAPVPTATDRATGAEPGAGWTGRARLVGWLAPLAVTLVAFGMRVWRLGDPARFAFDETYYAKDAWSLLNFGYVRSYLDQVDGVDVNDAILDGRTTGVWADDPSMIVHPEVGKWLIALGEKAFGMDPFGWRISAAVVGSLMVLVMCRLVLRLTGSLLLGCLAGALLALDGMHLVLSRVALLDIFLAFFLLCGVACVVNDRYWMRARMARLVPEQGGPGPGGWGPVRGLLLRPWLLAGGVSFGLAVGTKWTALFPLAALGLMTWLWSAGARRSFGVRWAVLRSAVVDGAPAFVHLVVVAGLVYVATWTGWLVHADQYEEHLSSTQYTRFVAERPCTGSGEDRTTDHEIAETGRWPTATEPDASGLGEVTQSLRSLWYYHQDVYTFHSHFLDCSDHTYESKPLAWPLLNRTVGVAADLDIAPGEQGCAAPEDSECLEQVLLLGTPMIWWAGCLALLYAAAVWLGARDWRFGLAVVGFVSTWLPWTAYDDRPIFSFYAIAMLPFLVIALTLAVGRLIGSSRPGGPRRTGGVVAAGAFVVLVLVNAAWFWPVWTHELLTRSEWLDRMWFRHWI